jgi:predicted alpha/beta hydrolase
MPRAGRASPASVESGPSALEIQANDGFRLAATLFRPRDATRAVLIVNSAMAVPRRHYADFAQAASERHFAVVTYDYRGIGGSAPASMRGFAARASDWMTLDFEAVLAWTRSEIGAPQTYIVGHSFGGNAFGLAPSAPTIDGGLFVAAQSGYWKHWSAPRRYVLASLWYGVTPLLPRVYGYMPGWAGIGNDVPTAVMTQWSGWCRQPRYAADDRSVETSGYGRVAAPLRFISLADDHDYAPAAAVKALMALYPAARGEHLHVVPREHGVERIGHFGFFRHPRLWPLALDWLAAQVEQKQ